MGCNVRASLSDENGYSASYSGYTPEERGCVIITNRYKRLSFLRRVLEPLMLARWYEECISEAKNTRGNEENISGSEVSRSVKPFSSPDYPAT